MKGGRIRGQGTYGCVFQPKLKCKKKRGQDDVLNRSSSMVGKITLPQDAENELAIATYLSTIPDAKLYTLAPEPESCEPQARSRQVEPDLEVCQLLADTPLENTIQIEMPWGGYPLSRMNLHPSSFDFMKFTEQILTIGSFLLLHKICHFDLYGQNFLFDKNTVPKLIDFGFAFRADEITSEALDSRWRQLATDHDTETPEVSLMLGVQQNIPPSFTIHELQQNKPAVQRLAVLCGVVPAEWSADLQKWSEQSLSFQNGDWTTCCKLYWPGFDAWSMGAMLLQIFEIQVSIPEFKVNPKIIPILKGLCEASPVKRMDALEALNALVDGSHAFVSAGSDGAAWISEKQRLRSLHS